MTEEPVPDLKTELRNLGYLSHGLERWFAHDPWSSRTFWAELLAVTGKVALVAAIFSAALTTTLLAIHNDIAGGQVVTASLLYFVGFFVLSAIIFILIALLLRLRLDLVLESPRLLTWLGVVTSAALSILLGVWALGFSSATGHTTILVTIVLIALQFIATAIVVPAALLSFSIHETHQLPRIHRRSRFGPVLVGGLLVLVAVWARAITTSPAEELPPPQVVVRPSEAKVALLGVDGLTAELLRLHPQLASTFETVREVPQLSGSSSPSVWATIGTGVPPELHRVRAVEGLRLLGGDGIVQELSTVDLFLPSAGRLLGIASGRPLPPSERERHYIWEILSERGVPAAAVNWWATGESSEPLRAISQGEVHARASLPEAADRAVEIDELTAGLIEEAADENNRFVTGYFPGLDIALNRLELTERKRVSVTIAELEILHQVLGRLVSAGYTVILAGQPGAGRDEPGVIATTAEELSLRSPLEIAPVVLNLFGFPASDEMADTGAAGERIPSYGNRRTSETRSEVDEDYYDSLRSLGYL